MGRTFQSKSVIVNGIVINLDEAIFLTKKNDDIPRFEALMKLREKNIVHFDEHQNDYVQTPNRVWSVLESEFPKQYYRYNKIHFNFAKLCSYINDYDDEEIFLAYLTISFQAGRSVRPENHQVMRETSAYLNDDNVIKCSYEPKHYFNFFVKKSMLSKYNLLLV